MKRVTVALATLLLSSALAGAAPKSGAPARSKQPTAEVKYRAHCGMIYSAAEAKKYHYICPMDHKPLVKITAGSGKGQTTTKKARG